jgi:hypothetical protein
LARQALGELVYLSERKLLNLGAELGIDPGWVELERTVERGGSLGVLGLRGGGKATTRSEPLDPRARDRALEALLERVLSRMDAMPDLDTSEAGVADDRWFRFERPLRFGIGLSDSDYSVNAFVLVDREAVPVAGFAPGLLMNGSAVHVRDPYRRDDPGDYPGNRSGSSTGRLFEWLCKVDLARDEQAGAAVEFADEQGPLSREDDGWIAVEMYRAFARSDSMTSPRFPDVLNHARCEGVAQVSRIATHDRTTVVMASPLYVRRLSLQGR